jgi:hypothetical protein
MTAAEASQGGSTRFVPVYVLAVPPLRALVGTDHEHEDSSLGPRSDTHHDLDHTDPNDRSDRSPRIYRDCHGSLTARAGLNVHGDCRVGHAACRLCQTQDGQNFLTVRRRGVGAYLGNTTRHLVMCSAALHLARNGGWETCGLSCPCLRLLSPLIRYVEQPAPSRWTARALEWSIEPAQVGV